MPVVEVQNVGWVSLDKCSNRPGEPEEAFVVVDPAAAVGIEVRMRTCHAWHADQVQRANLGVAAAPHDRCADPVRHLQGCDGFIDQCDVAIVGHHEVDVDA